MDALLFVDVTDAASYVGSVRFERAAALFTILTGEPVSIGYRASDRQGARDVDEYRRAAQVTGIDLNLDELVPVADTTDVWRLVTWAAATGPEAQRELVHQVWRAHFLEGADLADPLVVTSRAALAGLDLGLAEEIWAEGEFAGDVLAQRETAVALGADETPFIVIDAQHTIEGVRSQDDYVRVLRSLRAAEA